MNADSAAAGALLQELPARHLPSSNQFGDYELISEIARGGMGVVYKARQISLDRLVAVKMILHGQFQNAEFVQRFRAEAQAAANLHHPHIVSIYDIGEENGQHYFSMEYIEGRDLGSLVRDQPLPAKRAAKNVQTIAEAIHYAHQHGILHRDLKPSNVLIDAEGELRVMDFGLAKRITDPSFGGTSAASPTSETEARQGTRSARPSSVFPELTVSGQVLGSPNYMSPEQAAGKSREVTVQSDVYSLGAILYYLVTGRPPFMAETMEATLLQVLQLDVPPPRLLNPSVPRDIETICLKCLEKDPAKRYASAQQVAEELGRFWRDEPLLARPVSRPEKIWRWCKRHPLDASLTAATVACLLAIAIGSPIAVLRIDKARRESVQKAAESKERLRRLNIATGISAMETGDLLGALPWLVNALSLDRAGSDSEQMARLRLGAVFAEAPRLLEFWSLNDPVRVAEFGPDGKRLVILTQSEQVERAFVASESDSWRLTPFGAPDERIHRMAMSPANDRIVFGTRSNQLHLLMAGSLQAVCAPIELRGKVRDVRFTPDGRTMYAATTDGRTSSIRQFESANGASIGTPWNTQREPERILVSPDGSELLVINDRRAWLHTATNGALLMPPLLHATTIIDAIFSHDGRTIVTTSSDGTAHISSITNDPLSVAAHWSTITLRHGSNMWVLAADISPDGRLLATATSAGTGHIWEMSTGVPVTPTFRHAHAIRRIRFNPDGTRVITASFDKTARVWDVRTGEPVISALRHNGFVAEAAFAPDGSRMVTAGQDGVVRLWQMPPGLLRWSAENPGIETAAFSRDGSRLLTGSQDGTVRLWDAKTGRSLATIQEQRDKISAVAFSPDDRVFATASSNGTTVLYATATGEPLFSALRHQRLVTSLAFSPEGSRIVTTSEDGSAQVWDAETGNPVGEMLQHARTVRSAVFSADGKKVATGSEDKTAQVWDAATGQALGPAFVHDSHVLCVLFSPDGSKLATAVSDETFAARAAHLWDLASGQEILPPMPHTDGVETLAFSPDGLRLATGSEDGTACMWDVATHQWVTPPMQHDYHILSAQFVANGRAFFTAGRDGAVRLWDGATGEAVTPRLRYERMLLKAGVSADGREIAYCRRDGHVMVFSVPYETRSLAELRNLSELLTSRRLDPEAGLIPASVESLEARWRDYRAERVTR